MENVNKRDISSSKRGYELVNFCEFDKYAAQSYCAIHEVDPELNLGDITKVDETKLKPFNMICGVCQHMKDNEEYSITYPSSEYELVMRKKRLLT
jgi:uncharacterized CHY-type Zn-finger protein